jgi:hypothetical protein
VNPTPSPEPPSSYWRSPFEDLLPQEPTMERQPTIPGTFQQPPPFIGTPGQDAASWDGPQQYPDDCAIKCQQFILQQFTGQHVNEHVLVREALDRGWYTPGGGTLPQDVGNLLELHGVHVHRYEHASIFHLAVELSQGHKVIVGVDSKELWQGNSVLEEIFDNMGFAHADHAVVVSGIDTSDPDHIRVIVSDPGNGSALGSYPLEQFLDAWRDSQFFMVATTDPAPPHLPEMAHFDYDAGHIPMIADVSYDELLSLADQRLAWEGLVHQYVENHHDLHAHPGLGGGQHDDPIPIQHPDVMDLGPDHDDVVSGHHDHHDADWIHDHPDFSDPNLGEHII